jgi:hypothetical protein
MKAPLAEPPRADIGDRGIVLLTNFIPPYQKPVLDRLTQRYPNLRVLLSTPMESDRPWKLAVFAEFAQSVGSSCYSVEGFECDAVLALCSYSTSIV